MITCLADERDRGPALLRLLETNSVASVVADVALDDSQRSVRRSRQPDRRPFRSGTEIGIVEGTS